MIKMSSFPRRNRHSTIEHGHTNGTSTHGTRRSDRAWISRDFQNMGGRKNEVRYLVIDETCLRLSVPLRKRATSLNQLSKKWCRLPIFAMHFLEVLNPP